MLVRNNLNDIMKPGKPMPSKELMVKKALEILEYSPHGQQLANFVEKRSIVIDIVETPTASTYLPEEGKIYIGLNKNNPPSPSAFVLMITGAVREAQQDAAGITHPTIFAPLDEHLKISMAKYEDTLWYICTVALELDAMESFKPYKFLDELRKIGYSEVLDLVIKQRAE